MIVLASSANVLGEGQLDRENPWPGLASYDEQSHRYFSGRAAESDEALRRILDEPVTVLFGKSGLGKTSLLNAGVFPRLRDRHLLPVLVRLHVQDGAGPLIEQVYRRLIEEFNQHGVDYPERAEGVTLWEYLHRSAQEFWTPQNRLARPVIVFDQFEELFTLGRDVPERVNAFREDLADLAENRIPALLASRADDAIEGDASLNTRAMPYKIVIALREDFLADLEGWRQTMPSLRRNRMRLLPMGPDQALAAVHNERTRHLVSEPLGRTIVTFLSACGSAKEGDHTHSDGTVEPALLSLFCRGINEQRKKDGKASFDSELIEGAQGTIVRDFYVACLADQPERVRRFIEGELVTKSGFRNSYSVKDATQAGVITTAELDTLINRHLLRHEHHLGTDRVELTHDLLTNAVADARDRRFETDRARRERWQQLKFGTLAAASASIALLFAVLWANAAAERARADGLRVQADVERKTAVDAKTRAEDLQKGLEESVIRLHAKDNDLRKALDDSNEHAQIAADERDRADAERSRSLSRELAAHAQVTMDADPQLAIALGLRAMEVAETTEVRSTLIDVARYAWPYANLWPADLGGDPKAVAVSKEGGRLVVLAGVNAISVWDVTVRQPVRLWPRAFPASAKADEDDPATSVAFSPDEKTIAVGRLKGVDLIDADSGRVTATLSQFTKPVTDRRVVFSPDGQWLASNHADKTTVLLANLADPGAEPEKIEAKHTIGGFAIVRGGGAIVTVGGGSPLVARKFSRRDGKWVEDPFDLLSCVRPQSVSPGAEFVSATWSMSACIIRVGEMQSSTPRDTEGGSTDDIVWSTGGAAFVELVAGPQGMLDLVVGRRTGSGELKSRIKGAHPVGSESEKSRLLSVSELGTRVALIDDDDDHKLVRVYSVGGYKPFLSAIESAFAVAPDGSWIAIARPDVGTGPQTATINVIPLEQAFAPTHLAHAQARIKLDRQPSRLYASASSVVVVHGTGPSPTTTVFDARTGNRRFEPLRGSARPLGSAGEMLLLPGRGGVWRVVRTADGAPIEEWKTEPEVEDILAVRVSPSAGALAVFRQSARSAGTANATLFAVRRDRLVLTGEITNLPRRWSDMAITEDARSLTYGEKVWHVGRGASAAATGKASAALTSPLGRFEIHQDAQSKDNLDFRIIRRHDRALIATARDFNFRFSADDRWLAVWDDVLTVYDLSRGEAAFRFEEVVESDSVAFAGPGILHVRFVKNDNTTSMLIPLDWRLTERFLRWLTPRTLTPRDECTFGLRDRKCWNERSVRAQKTLH